MDAHARQVAALFDLVANDYDLHVPFFSAFAEEFVPWLGIEGDALVLDVGSGRGALAGVAARRGATVVAADLSMGMLQLNPALRCRMDAADLGIRSSAFDCVMGAFSFHLLSDPAAGLRESARTLRGGGTLGLAMPGSPPPEGSAGALVMAVLAKYPRTGVSILPPPVPFDPIASFDLAGLTDVVETEVSICIAVADGETYLRGERSHGFRSLFESVDPSERDALEAELLDVLGDLGRRGALVLDRSARFVRGRRPG